MDVDTWGTFKTYLILSQAIYTFNEQPYMSNYWADFIS